MIEQLVSKKCAYMHRRVSLKYQVQRPIHGSHLCVGDLNCSFVCRKGVYLYSTGAVP